MKEEILCFIEENYIVKKEFVESFNDLFNDINLPNQLMHGSRLVGRWMLDVKEDEVEIFAIWEYKSYEDYKKIEASIRSDKEHVNRILDWYNRHGGKEFVLKTYFVEVKNEVITSTLRNVTK